MGPVRKFQSTLPHGERQRGHRQKQPSGEFQSTLPHGERRQNQQEANKIERFNPRSRTGSDSLRRFPRKVSVQFQSTLPHGERLPSMTLFASFFQFQSTLPHGERPGRRNGECRAWGVSIHAPARGATAVRAMNNDSESVSIHAPARGATAKSDKQLLQNRDCISILHKTFAN